MMLAFSCRFALRSRERVELGIELRLVFKLGFGSGKYSEFRSTRIICHVHKHRSMNFRVIDSAAKQLTKTAITVTAIFIVALGYDLWYYLLGHLGVTKYVHNSPLQKYGNLCI